MAAVAQLRATQAPPIPLKAFELYENYPTVRISHTSIDANKVSTTKKQDLVYAPDASNKERLLRSIVDYERKSDKLVLNIQDDDRHTKLMEILGGHMQLMWETHVKNCASKTNTDFRSNVRDFLLNYLPSNAFHIQKEYLSRASKPFHMDCFDLASRLQLINEISVLLPGSSGKKLYNDSNELKTAMYRLMLPTWQLAFEATGLLIDDTSMTMQRLAQFFETQRLHHNAAADARRRQNQQGNNRGFRGNPRSRPYQPQNGYNGYRPPRINAYGNNNAYGGRGYNPQGNFRNQSTQVGSGNRYRDSGSQTRNQRSPSTSTPAHLRSRHTPPRMHRSDNTRDSRSMQGFYGQRGRGGRGRGRGQRRQNDMFFNGEGVDTSDTSDQYFDNTSEQYFDNTSEQYFDNTCDDEEFKDYTQDCSNDGYFATETNEDFIGDEEHSDAFFSHDSYAQQYALNAPGGPNNGPYDAYEYEDHN